MASVDYSYYVKKCTVFLQRLIQTPSVNGEHAEATVAQLLIAEATKLGLPSRVVEVQPGRPNVFVGNGFNDPETLLLVAHADTVPVGDESAWQYPPFSGKRVGDRMYGRGAIDCKGGIAAGLYVLKILQELGLGGVAKLIVVVDEEGGADSPFGMRAALDQGLRAKGAIYLYGGGPDKAVIIGHRGLLRLWVTCRGEAAHSGSRAYQDGEKGENAIMGLATFLQEVQTLCPDTSHRFFEGYKTLITPTLIQGGTGESIVPSSASALLDIRTLPQDNQTVLTTVHELVTKLSTKKRHYRIEIKNNIPAALSDPQSILVHEVVAVMRQYLSVSNPVLKASGPANESYMLIGQGIPTVAGFGPRGGGFHAANEYAEVASMRQSLELLVELARRMKPTQA